LAMFVVFVYLIPICTFMCLFSMVIQRYHFLIRLLALEGIVLTLTLIRMVYYSVELYSIIIILTFGACEASLGLGIMVKISRSFGNDLFNSINIRKC